MQAQSLIKIIFSVLFIFSFSTSNAQGEYRWDKNYEPSPAIPVEFETEDAVIIYNYEERQTQVINNAPFTRDIIKRRYKILTQKGLEDYTRFWVARRYDMGVEVLDARTLKADGSIVDFDSKDILELEYDSEKDLLDKDKYYRFSVPGVEVGDEVEFVIIFEGNTLHSGGNIFLHNSLPVMHSEFQLYVNEKIIVFTAPVNGMPDPQVKRANDHYRFVWTQKNLPGVFDMRGAIPGQTLSYFVYEFDYSMFYGSIKPTPPQNWEELMLKIDENLEMKSNAKKLDAVLTEILGDKVDEPKLAQAQYIHNWINDNITVRRLNENEKSGYVDTYFKSKTADWTVLLAMYEEAFKWIGANYYLGTGRSKFLGGIVLEFPTEYQVTDYFYLIEDEVGGIHLFPPKNSRRTWQMDEVPRHLRSTNVYILNMKEKTGVKQIALQSNPYNKNQMLYKAKADIDFEQKTMTHQIQELYNGEVSTYYRNATYEAGKQGDLVENLEKAWQEKCPNAKVSTVKLSDYPAEQPFKYTLNLQVETPNQVNEIETGTYKVSLGNWMTHNTLKVPKGRRTLDYHPPYAFVEAYNYFINTSEPATVKNKANIDIKVDNEIGTFEMSVNQMKPNALNVRSRYILKVNSIPADKMNLLDELNEAAANAANAELILAKE